MDVQVFIGLLIGLATMIVIWFLRQQSYWRRRGIPHSKPMMLASLTTKHFTQILRETYQQFKGTGPFFGFFLLATNTALVTDLELVKKVLVKDFNHFSDRGLYNNAHDDPLSANMFFAETEQWKRLRTKVTPTFTSGKMKNMFHMVTAVGERLMSTVSAWIGDGDPQGLGKLMDVTDLSGRYTTDAIGTCAFGLECNSLSAETPEFVLVTNSFTHHRRHNKVVEGLIFSFPKVARFLRMRIMPQHVHDFYIKLVQDTLEYRKRTALRRNDFLDLLIDMMEREDADGNRIEGLSVNEIAAQTFVVFLAGFETSAITMSFALYLLAQHVDVQEHLRQEINEVLASNDDRITYDVINQMGYLQQVIFETLRMYPIVPNLMRKAQSHYDTGDPKYYIEKGTMIIIPTIAIHYDPEYYPDPERFDPARFTAEEIQRRPTCSWLPFGEGPRNCIGMRFGRMQTSIGLIYLIRNFRFSTAAETEIPCPMEKSSFVVSPQNGIKLRVDRVEDAKPIERL
ncbi:PREDICTED: probable cytochrome P450 6a23 [Rhagoletis zephyria]|uniref:probable cytochrome P450 6a23 n=1 Tax=Rhagoletis zephyria TaxID=28612 RepID=UPI0008112A2D|nr:PREDICTED: probable cytochrome P450 6a23 [Rhagoletis zephyria]